MIIDLYGSCVLVEAVTFQCTLKMVFLCFIKIIEMPLAPHLQVRTIVSSHAYLGDMTRFSQKY